MTDTSKVKSLETVMQKWAETLKRMEGMEPTNALRWYLRGRYDQAMMDAERARQISSTTVVGGPPENGVMPQAIKSALLMVIDQEDEDGS